MIEHPIRRLVVELPAEQHQALKIEAAARGIPLKQLARERLIPHIRQETSPHA